jgi:hypothetical protein
MVMLAFGALLFVTFALVVWG